MNAKKIKALRKVVRMAVQGKISPRAAQDMVNIYGASDKQVDRAWAVVMRNF